MAFNPWFVIQRYLNIWILTSISLEGVHTSFDGDHCQKFVVRAGSSTCIDKETTINAMLTLESLSARNSATCISKCYLDYRCSLAVFMSPNCVLMSSQNGTKTSLPFALDQADCNAFTVLNIRCLNGGTPQRYSCHCPDEFTGPACELAKAPRCQAKMMTAIVADEFTNLTRVGVPLKASTSMGDGNFIVYRIDYFYKTLLNTPLLLTEPTLSLALPERTFASPPGMSFNMFLDNPGLVSIVLGTDGQLYPGLNPNKLLYMFAHSTKKMPYNTDDRAFYDSEYGQGDPRAIVEGLSKGHRLMYRNPVTVAFDPSSQSSVHVSRITIQAKHTPSTFTVPFEFLAFAHDMASDKLQTVAYRFGISVEFIETSVSPGRWELDDCWNEPTPPGSPDILNVLKEAALSGQEIRVIQDDFLSSDVIQVTLTPNDLVVEVAPYFYPPDNSEPLSVDSVVVHSAFSPNKTLARCERRIHKANDSSCKYFPNSGSNYRWFISERTWTLILKTDHEGVATEGSGEDLCLLAGQFVDIRVCIEFNDQQTMCISDGTIKSLTFEHILYQTRPFIKPSFDADGFFQGFLDPLCSSYEYLISTTGWIKGVSYVIGNNTATYDMDVDFKSVSWFVNN